MGLGSVKLLPCPASVLLVLDTGEVMDDHAWTISLVPPEEPGSEMSTGDTGHGNSGATGEEAMDLLLPSRHPTALCLLVFCLPNVTRLRVSEKMLFS